MSSSKKVDGITDGLKILEDYGYIKSVSLPGQYDRGRLAGDRYALNPRHFARKDI